jgi:hypothetical protein
MKFRNISEETLTVPRATGPVTVGPGEEVLGSPVLLAGLVESGHLEPVTDIPLNLPDPTPGKHRAQRLPTDPD